MYLAVKIRFKKVDKIKITEILLTLLELVLTKRKIILVQSGQFLKKINTLINMKGFRTLFIRSVEVTKIHWLCSSKKFRDQPKLNHPIVRFFLRMYHLQFRRRVLKYKVNKVRHIQVPLTNEKAHYLSCDKTSKLRSVRNRRVPQIAALTTVKKKKAMYA